MNRIEFISELRKNLTGEVSTSEMQDAVRYYEEYIDMQIKKGKAEDEVIRELGDPRLLAKSIIAASGKKGGFQGHSTEPEQESAYRQQPKASSVQIPGWLIGLLVILVILAVISAIFSLLMYLLPVILVIAGVAFLYRWFKER